MEDGVNKRKLDLLHENTSDETVTFSKPGKKNNYLSNKKTSK